MLPIVGVRQTMQRGLLPYRKLFGRAEGFEHVSRYITGGLLSANKTRQGIYADQVGEGDKPSRRALHEAVFAAGGDADSLLPRQRAVIAPEHQGRGREVICVDWTLLHHERGPELYGVTKRYDYVAKRMGWFQTGVRAVVAHRQVIDGLELQVQAPSPQAEEARYWTAPVQASYEQRGQARERVWELLHHLPHRLADQKRTAIGVEVVAALEEEGQLPSAH
jgi:hypothetical protein